MFGNKKLNWQKQMSVSRGGKRHLLTFGALSISTVSPTIG